MSFNTGKAVLILGANSDVAKELIRIYATQGHQVTAASRSTAALESFIQQHHLSAQNVTIRYFDATDFKSHQAFYESLPVKPHTVVYAAGYLKNNEEALRDWEGSFQMMQVHYCGAVSILNIIATDSSNTNLERIIGLSSLSGVRGRKSNFIYGSTKSAFTQRSVLSTVRNFINITLPVSSVIKY